MNTPVHVIANLLFQGHQKDQRLIIPIVLGSFLPDAPLVFFYCFYKLIVRADELTIWQYFYHLEAWQNLFDIFNSLPIFVLASLFLVIRKSQWLSAFFLSIYLHCVADLMLRHSDAQRHFFPLSDWKFRSPFSSWESSYYGEYFLYLELLLMTLGVLYLMASYTSTLSRIFLLSLSGFYFLYVILDPQKLFPFLFVTAY